MKDFYRQAREAAQEFRTQHHLGTAPIADIVSILDNLPRVHVAVLPSTSGDHHGMRAHDPERQVTLLAACATPHAVRLRSTLAHELGHHVFADPTPSAWSTNSLEEKRATEFARHLLIPLRGLSDLLGDPAGLEVDEEVLSKVVERFAVSPHMAAIQMRDARYITADAVDRFSGLSAPRLAARYGWSALYRQWSHDSQVERPPQRIVAAATMAYIGGDVSIEVLANLRDQPTGDVRAELDEAGLVPKGLDGDDLDSVEDDVDWSLLRGEDTADGF